MMKQEAIFKKLGNILGELNDQYEFLADNPKELSELELELFSANVNFLAEHVQIIKKLNLPTNDQYVAPIFKEEQKTVSPVVPAFVAATLVAETVPPIENDVENFNTLLPKVNEDLKPSITEEESSKTFEFLLNREAFSDDLKFDFEEKNADELFDRPLSKEEELILSKKRNAINLQNLPLTEELIDIAEEKEVEIEEDEVGPEPFLIHHEEVVEPIVEVEEDPLPQITKPVAALPLENQEQAIEARPTLNDLLAQKNSVTRVNDAQMNMVEDLKASINLNDKLLYIKDLFNGYNLAYAEAIDLANKMPNFNAADSFFQKNYAEKNNWAEKQATVDKFYLLLNRRFKD